MNTAQHDLNKPDDDENGLSHIEYARAVGSRLRLVRQWLRLSLQAVEAMSEQEFKASVLGAYERGERAISVPRLQRLARLYQVPVDYLLPQEGNPIVLGPLGEQAVRSGVVQEVKVALNGSTDKDESVSIDLAALESMNGPEADLLKRFLERIQAQRHQAGATSVTIRSEDLRALQNILGEIPQVSGPPA